MYIDDTLAMSRRRWPILVLGVLATAALAVGVFRIVPLTYRSQASVLLVPPATAEVENPFFALGGLASATDVVVRAVTDQAVVDKIVAEGGNDKFTVDRDLLVSSPIMLITSEGNSPEDTLNTLQLVLDQVPITLKALQADEGVAKGKRITSSVVAREDRPATLRKSQIRIAVVVVVGGLGLTVGLAALVDNWAARRRIRRAARAARAAQKSGSGPAGGEGDTGEEGGVGENVGPDNGAPGSDSPIPQEVAAGSHSRPEAADSVGATPGSGGRAADVPAAER